MKRKPRTIKLRTASGGVKVIGNTIRDVAVLALGPAKNHGFIVDSVMLNQCVQQINAAGRIKVRMTHPDSDDLPHVVGFVTNAKLAGDTCRAMLVLLESSPHKQFVLEMAASLPDQFGCSIEASVFFEDQGGQRVARIEKLKAVDLVGEPAGTHNGLLSTHKGTLTMDESTITELKSLLGLAPEATDQEVLDALKAMLEDQSGSVTEPDTALSAVTKAASTAVKNERDRSDAIRGLCSNMKLSADIGEQWVRDGLTIAEAGKLAVQMRMRLDSTTTPAIGATARSNAASNSSILTAATLIRMGRRDVAERHFKSAMPQVLRMSVNNSRDLARAAVRLSGRELAGESDQQIIRLAFSSSDLPTAIGSAIEKTLIEAYNEQPATWRSWAGVKTAQSFREHKAVRPVLANAGYREVGPQGEIEHGSFEEEVYSYRVATFARMFTIAMQHAHDDDLGVFDEIAQQLAREAARKVSDDVYGLLLDNPGDHFHSNNSNLETGGDSVLNVDGLTTAVQSLRKRKDSAGRMIGLVPKVLLVTAELEQTARRLVNSAELSRDSQTDLLPTGNSFQGTLAIEVEPRLSDTSFHASASETAWYLLAGPRDPSFVVAFLDGKETPTVEASDAEFNRLGQSMRGYLSFGVAAADPRTAVRSDGA